MNYIFLHCEKKMTSFYSWTCLCVDIMQPNLSKMATLRTEFTGLCGGVNVMGRQQCNMTT